VIADHEPAIGFSDLRNGAGLGLKPVLLGIELAQFRGSRLRVEANQAATETLDDVKRLLGSVVEAIGTAEQSPDAGVAAGRTIGRRGACVGARRFESAGDSNGRGLGSNVRTVKARGFRFRLIRQGYTACELISLREI
jgi:hypothetical protein